jgi:hypothetical protein
VQVLSKSTSSSDSLTADDFNLDELIAAQNEKLDNIDLELPAFDLTKVYEAIAWYKENVQPIFDWILDHKDGIVKAFIAIVAAILLFNLIKSIANTIIWFSKLSEAVSKLSGLFQTLGAAGILPIIGKFALIAAVILIVVAAFVYFYVTCEDFRNVVNEIFGSVKDTIDDAGRAINDAFSRMGINLEELGGIFGVIGKGIMYLVLGIVVVVAAVIKVIAALIVDLGVSIGESVEGIKGMFSGIIDFLVGVFTGDWDRAWNGIKKIFGNFLLWFVSGIDGVIEAINTLLGIDIETPGEKIKKWLFANTDDYSSDDDSDKVINRNSKSTTSASSTSDSTTSSLESSISANTESNSTLSSTFSDLTSSLSSGTFSFDTSSITDSFDSNYSDLTSYFDSLTYSTDSASAATQTQLQISNDNAEKLYDSIQEYRDLISGEFDLLFENQANKAESDASYYESMINQQTMTVTLLSELIAYARLLVNSPMSVYMDGALVTSEVVSGINAVTKRTGKNPLFGI